MVKASLALIIGLVVGIVVGLPIGNMLVQSEAKALDLRLTLRDLWVDHIFWARSAVIAAKLGDKEAMNVSIQKVLDNAKKMSSAVATIYGKEAGDRLLQLLNGHAKGVVDYAVGALSKDEALKSKANQDLYRNAEDIANFLSSANPRNWSKETLLALLNGHVGHHIMQINTIVAGDWEKESGVWKEMVSNVYQIADALTDGIVKQFPDKFK